MAIISEDGTGREDAECYGSVDGATSYAEAFGRTEWQSLIAPDREIRLRLATQYIDTMYEARGTKINEDQALSFPTIEKKMPAAVVRATYELATYPGLPKLLPGDSRSRVESESKELAGLKKTVKYDLSKTDRKRFYVADGLLKPYTRAVSTGSGMASGVLLLS